MGDLARLISMKQIPHALLFLGAPGLGKKQCALDYSHFLLCQNPGSAPCHHCHACHLIKAQSHPDLMVVEPEQEGQRIKIDQIRELIQFLSETALQASKRIVIINPASAMNNNAANALLKTLEEPAPNTLLILINDLNLRLPATIISRCQRIIFKKPPAQESLEWLSRAFPDKKINLPLLLQLAEGAPLKAKEWVDKEIWVMRDHFYQDLVLLAKRKNNPLKVASQYQEAELPTLLNLFFMWLRDMLCYSLTQDKNTLMNSDYGVEFSQIKKTGTFFELLNLVDYVNTLYQSCLSALNLNRQLVLEELFIRWVNYAAG